ncbi:MAG: DUF3373 domain-containing protein [Epsilonproteobacteria bacterium]|nr:DUF3373 domain-containing protein [Campylobacterota bacterium]
MKKYLAMSVVTAFVVSTVNAADLKNVPMAKTYPTDVEKQAEKVVEKEAVKVEAAKPAVDYDAKIKKLEKSLKKLQKQVSAVKSHGANDNIKFGVDFRTSVDSIEYKTASGKTHKNDSLLSNRLWLNMAYAPSENMIFKGKLSYNKAYGASPTNLNTGFPQRGFGYDTFDWVLNENLLDDNIRLKEAYWLYMNESFLGTDIDWTASFGRRPSTNGFLVSLRDEDKPASPLGHAINVEFDGASFKFGLEKVTGIPGMYWKACLGRGLTNARSRFNMDGGFASTGDYSKDPDTLKNVDLAGFIFVPYDDGQYKVMTTAYRGFNVPGFAMANGTVQSDFSIADGTGMVGSIQPVWDATDGTFQGAQGGSLNSNLQMVNTGDIDGAAISFLVDGVGDGINDFLDDTKLFASFAMSKTHPDNEIQGLNLNAFNDFVGYRADQIAGALNGMMGTSLSTNPADYMDPTGAASQALGAAMAAAANAGDKVPEGMLGSNDDETGTSYWIGMQVPAMITEEGRIGVEFNHGSKYWRSFTYAEDTLVGSKLAARGDAFEVYYSQPLTKAFSMQLRYTKIDYEYTGSQNFFGAGGTPMTMAEAKAFGMDPIEEAEDIRLSFRYRF